MSQISKIDSEGDIALRKTRVVFNWWFDWIISHKVILFCTKKVVEKQTKYLKKGNKKERKKE